MVAQHAILVQYVCILYIQWVSLVGWYWLQTPKQGVRFNSSRLLVDFVCYGLVSGLIDLAKRYCRWCHQGNPESSKIPHCRWPDDVMFVMEVMPSLVTCNSRSDSQSMGVTGLIPWILCFTINKMLGASLCYYKQQCMLDST